MKFLKGLIVNLQFFTALPIRIEIPMDKAHLNHAARTFPILGLMQGAFYAGLMYVLMEWTPLSTTAIAFILWLAMILATGGLHLDGWMDVSDAFFSYQDQKRRLEIMSDSRIGAFGVLSVIVFLSARFLFIFEVISEPLSVVYALVLLIPFLSKSVMGAALLTVKPAKDSGLAVLFQSAGTARTLAVYPFYLAAAVAVCFFIEPIWIWPVLILSGVAVISLLLIRNRAVKWFGGITGDVLGASVEGTELLLWMTLWLLHYFAMV